MAESGHAQTLGRRLLFVTGTGALIVVPLCMCEKVDDIAHKKKSEYEPANSEMLAGRLGTLRSSDRLRRIHSVERSCGRSIHDYYRNGSRSEGRSLRLGNDQPNFGKAGKHLTDLERVAVHRTDTSNGP